MEIYRPDILKRTAIFGGIGIVILMCLEIRSHYRFLNYQFNGRVDSVSYGDKGTPIVIMKRKVYYLQDSWNFHNSQLIKKGDSIMKEKNSSVVKLIKPDGQILIKDGE